MSSQARELGIMEDDLNVASKAWKREVGEGLEEVPRVENSHRCRQCKSVRWYPPLLTLSTVMSGIFCWLYVTKPVHVTQTIIEPSGPGLAFAEKSSVEPANEPLATVSTPSTSFELDPEMGVLPGEAWSSVDSDSIMPGQAVRPIVVTKAKLDLFKPMKAEEVDAALSERADQEDEDEFAVAKDSRLTVLPALAVSEAPAIGDAEGENPAMVEDSLENPLAEDEEKPIGEASALEGEGLRHVDDEASSAVASPGFSSVGTLDRVISSAAEGGTRRVAVSLMGEFVSDYIEYEAALADSKKE